MKTKSNNNPSKLQSEAVKQKPKELEWGYEKAKKDAKELADRIDIFNPQSNRCCPICGNRPEYVVEYINMLLTQQRTELEKKFKKDKKQPKDKLGDDFTKFLESEGYQVRDCEVEKCNHKWIHIEYDLMKCLKCNKVKKL